MRGSAFGTASDKSQSATPHTTLLEHIRSTFFIPSFLHSQQLTHRTNQEVRQPKQTEGVNTQTTRIRAKAWMLDSGIANITQAETGGGAAWLNGYGPRFIP